MNSITMIARLSTGKRQTQTIPHTSRGRALYTVDWFLNGRPVLHDHDNPRLDLQCGCKC